VGPEELARRKNRRARLGLRRFIGEVNGPVNVVRLPQASLAELAAAGVARVSWGTFLHLDAMARFEEQLASLQK
jgi:2-methylisocitrate lyase-like PEP mutase family enzyme